MEVHQSISLEAGTLRQLFWENFYRNCHPDVPVGLPCFLHFLKHGIDEGRDPNPFLQFSHIRSRYALSESSNLEILAGRSLLGQIETSPFFDSNYYRDIYRDEIGESLDVPLSHYLATGYHKSYRTHPNLLVIPTWLRERFVAAKAKAKAKVPVVVPADQQTFSRSILVVIPVYKDLAKTRNCIRSLYASGIPVQTRVVVVDDACPEPGLSEYLRDAVAEHGFQLLVNDQNLGFTDSVNRANDQRREGEDLLILNSDTVSPVQLIPRLAAYLDNDPTVATVTPLSNNATIATVPCIGEEFSLFRCEDSPSLDMAARHCQQWLGLEHSPLTLPTGVGFCMLINHKAIEAGALFDSSLFGKGYGEEVHFCQSTAKKGFSHALASDVFVWHYSGASFGKEKWQRIESSAKVINKLHPAYAADVGRFCHHDHLAVLRLFISLLVFHRERYKGILAITHALGGGIDRYLEDRAKTLGSGEIMLLLQPCRVDHFCEVILVHRGIRISMALEIDRRTSVADALRDLFPIHEIEVHSTVGYPTQFLFSLIDSLQLPFCFVVHDFTTICPRIQPRNDQDLFCGLPDTASCNRCLQRAGEAVDISAWRHEHQWLLYGAKELVTPSRNTADLLRSVQPGLDPVVRHHEDQDEILRERLRNQIERRRTHSREGPARVAVLGRLTPHKGLHLLESLCHLLKLHGLELIVIGSIEGSSPLTSQTNVRILGRYNDDDLPELITQVQPGVIMFTARWPETYSYTLSAALRSGFPVLAPDVGAFSERLQNLSECALYNLSDTPEHILTLLRQAMAGVPPSSASVLVHVNQSRESDSASSQLLS